MRVLSEWDADYVVNEIVPSSELRTLEKKSSAKFQLTSAGRVHGDTTDEIAKQVCAFSNASGGILVFGIASNNQLDDGVPPTVRGEDIKEWAEKTIPGLVVPPVNGCEALFLQVPGHHQADKGVFVISTPLSEHRPHWTTQLIPYIRAGEHSLPMSPQTLIDISHRADGSSAEIVGFLEERTVSIAGDQASHTVRPLVRLHSGVICRDWAIELRAADSQVRLSYPRNAEATRAKPDHVYAIGAEPLFPGRETFGLKDPLTVTCPQSMPPQTAILLVNLYTASGPPVRKVVTRSELDKALTSMNALRDSLLGPIS